MRDVWADIDLPKNWEVTPIREICTVVRGGSPRPMGDPRYFDGNIPFIKISDVTKSDGLRVYESECKVNEEGAKKSRLLNKGDLILSNSGTVCVPVFLGVAACIHDGFVAFDGLPDSIDQKYLYHFFKYIRPFVVEKHKQGVTQVNLNTQIVGETSLLLPPKKEQHRIVAKIEALFSELDKGVESLQTAREQLKVYRQAVLKHAFEGKLTAQWREENKDKLESPEQLLDRIQKEREARYQQQLTDWKAAVKAWEANGREGKKPAKPRKSALIDIEKKSLPALPNEWVWEYIGNLNADVFDGPFGSNLKTSDYVNDGVRVIRLENIGYLEFIENKQSYVTVEKYESIKNHTVYSGDIIFSSFVTDGIRVVVLPETIEYAVNKADCFCFRLHGESVRNDFAANFLSTRIAYKQIESEIHGVGRPRINTTQLKGLALPICSREEQNVIMAVLSERLSLIYNADATIDTELKKCEALRQSILKKAFSGQLVPQDPNDEPASILLERIEAEKAAKSRAIKKAKGSKPHEHV